MTFHIAVMRSYVWILTIYHTNPTASIYAGGLASSKHNAGGMDNTNHVFSEGECSLNIEMKYCKLDFNYFKQAELKMEKYSIVPI